LVDQIPLVAAQVHRPARQDVGANRQARRDLRAEAGLEQTARDQRKLVAAFDEDLAVDGKRMVMARHEERAAERRVEPRVIREPVESIAELPARIELEAEAPRAANVVEESLVRQ